MSSYLQFPVNPLQEVWLADVTYLVFSVSRCVGVLELAAGERHPFPRISQFLGTAAQGLASASLRQHSHTLL